MILKEGDRFYFKNEPCKIFEVTRFRDSGVFMHYICIDSFKKEDIGMKNFTDTQFIENAIVKIS